MLEDVEPTAKHRNEREEEEDQDQRPVRAFLLAPAVRLSEQVALAEPDVEQEEEADDDDEQEHREEVVADAGRRRVDSRAAPGDVVRAARSGDEPEEHEHPAREQQNPPHGTRAMRRTGVVWLVQVLSAHGPERIRRYDSLMKRKLA